MFPISQASSLNGQISVFENNTTIIMKSCLDMKSNTNLKKDDIVQTLGYSKANDGGGGKYIITNSNKSIDNGSVHKLDNGLKAELIIENNTVDIRQFGAIEGLNSDIKKNTLAIQNAINFTSDNLVLSFPSGWILTDTLSLGTGKNITLKGVSNNMGSYMNKANGDTFSKILYIQSMKDKPLFTQERTILILENLGLYGSTTVNNKKYGTGNSYLLKGDVVDRTIDYKGKVFATNCEFSGWGTVFGGASINYDASGNPTLRYIKSTRKEGSYLQTCVLATNCRFSNNDIALSQLVDGRIVGCSFNKNKYAIVFGPRSGYTTISSSRIEWNSYNGTYIDSSHDISLNGNEYDRNGRAAIYAINSENINITNNFVRRSGADENLKENDYKNNIHFYIKGITNSNVSNNITKEKYNYDFSISSDNTTGKKGINRPSNVSYFENNNGIIISNNCLNGGTRESDYLNIFKNNKNSQISNNLIKK